MHTSRGTIHFTDAKSLKAALAHIPAFAELETVGDEMSALVANISCEVAGPPEGALRGIRGGGGANVTRQPACARAGTKWVPPSVRPDPPATADPSRGAPPNSSSPASNPRPPQASTPVAWNGSHDIARPSRRGPRATSRAAPDRLWSGR